MRLAAGQPDADFSAERLFDDIERLGHNKLLVIDAVIVAHYAWANTEAKLFN